jgi:hypothetical protein
VTADWRVSTLNGLPPHILLNHFVVVLAPLTAILAIVCALWPAARRRLIWLVLLLAVGTLATLVACVVLLAAVHIREGQGSTVKLALHSVVGV